MKFNMGHDTFTYDWSMKIAYKYLKKSSLLVHKYLEIKLSFVQNNDHQS
jgi:hypothetical protein